MLTLEEAVTIEVLHGQGESIGTVGDDFGISPNPVRRQPSEGGQPRHGPLARRA